MPLIKKEAVYKRGLHGYFSGKSVIEKGRGKKEERRKEKRRTIRGRVFNVSDVFVRLEPQDDLIHRTKKSGQNLLNAVNLWILLSLLIHPG